MLKHSTRSKQTQETDKVRNYATTGSPTVEGLYEEDTMKERIQPRSVQAQSGPKPIVPSRQIMKTKPILSRSQSNTTLSSSTRNTKGSEPRNANAASLSRSKTLAARSSSHLTQSKRVVKSSTAQNSSLQPVSEHFLGQSNASTLQVSTASSSGGSSATSSVKVADQLQVAAQTVPWTYMLHTLDETYQRVEFRAHAFLTQKAQEISDQELKMSDKRTRIHLERLLSLYDELANHGAASDVILSFLAQGERCTKVTAQALQLVENTHSHRGLAYPLSKLNALIQRISELRELLQETATSVKDLGSAPILQLISQDCLPVLEARSKNLDIAFILMETARDNIQLSLELESMSITSNESRGKMR